MRNNLVHGNKYPQQAAIATARGDAQDLLRRGLLRATHEGFPTPETFARMLLGASIPAPDSKLTETPLTYLPNVANVN
jgi:hypothetical protein